MTFDQRGWLFTILTALIVSPAIYNEFAPKGDERATPAMRVVTPKGDLHSKRLSSHRQEAVLHLFPAPATFTVWGSKEKRVFDVFGTQKECAVVPVVVSLGSATPPQKHELGHGQRLASPNLRVAQPRKLASPSGAGHPGDSLESGQ